MVKKLFASTLLLGSFSFVAVSCSKNENVKTTNQLNTDKVSFVSKENDQKVFEFFKAFKERIKKYEKISIFGHVNTDGDSHGSTFGLKELIKDNFKDKEVRVYTDIDKNIPDNLRFLEEDEDKNNRGLVDEEYIKESLAISLDTATMDRVGNQNYKKAKEVIKMDHHIYGEYFDLKNTDIKYQLVYEASSASEMLTRLASHNK
jgi:nanoRNase/pAp phosphatase (c-di-AMP/oligoRNAs hydrolase)